MVCSDAAGLHALKKAQVVEAQSKSLALDKDSANKTGDRGTQRLGAKPTASDSLAATFTVSLSQRPLLFYYLHTRADHPRSSVKPGIRGKC